MLPFAQLANALDTPLVLTAPDGKCLWANDKAWAVLSAWQAGQDARTDEAYLPEHWRSCLWEFLRTGADTFELIDGGEHWQLVFKSLTDNEILLQIHNQTRLIHLEKMRSDFVGNISHELRTPLTVLMGYLENFVDNADSLPSAWQVGVSRMAEQAGRMNAIVNDLLTLSRLENDKHPEPQVVDMPRLLMQVCDEAQNSNPKSYLIDLHLDTAKKVQGLPIYLHSAILNLVLNALKYTQDDGEIDLIWEETDDGAVLTVADNGIGIGAEHLARLTERFYRVDTGRSRETGGTGLGLAIVKQVAILHNARLEIHSEVGVGSSFCLVFPKFRLVD